MQDLARKYRPKLLSDMVGQPVVVQTLTNAIKNNTLHHAYLFVGQFGAGKSSIVRILAAMENCSTSPGLNPCGQCEICKKIFKGVHTDVLEIDAASGAGKVDQVRKLKQSALYSPIDGCKTKYFILDECLPGDTMISMSDGSKLSIGYLVENHLLNSVKQNSVVRSRDMKTGEIINQEICRYIKIPNDKQMYEIKIKDELGDIHTVKITGNHSVFVNGEGKIKAQDLEVGQKVFLERSKNMMQTEAKKTQITVEIEGQKPITFEADEYDLDMKRDCTPVYEDNKCIGYELHNRTIHVFGTQYCEKQFIPEETNLEKE